MFLHSAVDSASYRINEMTNQTAESVTTKKGRVSYAVTGEGPPLVMLHSLLTDRQAFDRVVDALPGRVLALDLPGFGETDHAPATIEAFADSVAAAIEEIGRDDSPPVVMGNGLGAFVALALAIRRPGLLRRLVLVGCGATFPPEARPALQRMIDLVESGGMAAVTSVALRRIFTDEYLDSHPEEAEERTRVLSATNTDAFVNACRALHRLDLTDEVGNVATPTLIVVGEDDQATPPAMAIGLHELLPNSRLVTMPGVAHAPQLQDPAGFVEVVEQFLEES
jgi:3-oxoadipate enol-lactonase